MNDKLLSITLSVADEETARRLLDYIYGKTEEAPPEEKPPKKKPGKSKPEPKPEEPEDDDEEDEKDDEPLDDGDEDDDEPGESEDEDEDDDEDEAATDIKEVIAALKAYVGKNKKGEREKAISLLKKKFGSGNVHSIDKKHYPAIIKLFSK